MWYAIMAEDNSNSLEMRLANRPAHLARLHVLQEAGRLLLAGPFPAFDSVDTDSNNADSAGFTGSLIVAEFESLAVATAWAEADPFALYGVYAKVNVKPFRKTLPS